MEDLFKVFSWVMISLFIGIGIYFGYLLIGSIFDKFEVLENIFLRLIFLTVVGGITILIYKSFNPQKD
jgi:hypothetical protein